MIEARLRTLKLKACLHQYLKELDFLTINTLGDAYWSTVCNKIGREVQEPQQRANLEVK
jgi:hypothetical protein